MKLFLLFFLALQVYGAITFRSVQTTATQAVLSYTAPDTTACTHEVSEDASYSPVVNDVNTSLFASSNSDSRSGSISNGTSRFFVVGARTSAVATNGKYYSRALRAGTLHYYRITCGGDTSTGTFRTRDITLGSSYSDPLPGNPTSAGTYAYPSQNWASATAEYIDPLTGATLRRLTQPQDVTANVTSQSFSTTYATTGWTNPNNVLADDGSSAVFSGAGSNKLYVRVSNLALTDGGNGPVGLDYLRIIVKASGAAANPDDRVVNACWTIDSVNCASSIVTQTLTGSLATYNLGSTASGLAAWGAVPFVNRTDVIRRTGAGDYVSATKIVTRTSGTYFDLNWVSGTKFTYDGSEYAISSVTDVDHLVLQSGPVGDQTGKTWIADTFGILFWKDSASTDNITVQWLGYDLGASYMSSWTAGGFFDVCNSNSVTISGEVGYYCYILDSMGVNNMYWVGTAGSRRFLGRMWVTGGGADEVDVLQALNLQPDTADANISWAVVTNSSSKKVLLKITYDGTNTDVAGLTWPQTGGHFTYSNITPSASGNDLNALAHTYDATFPQAGMYSCSHVRAVQNGNLLIWCLADGAQDRMGYAMAFDPGNGGVLGAGGTGTVLGLTDFHTQTGARWCRPHSIDPLGNVDYLQMTTNSMAGGSLNGNGQYRTTLNGGINDIVTTITVNSEPCDPDPGPNETNTNNPNCLLTTDHYVQNAAVGDFLLIDSEYMKITGKSGNSWTVERASAGTGGYIFPAASHSNGADVLMQCSARGTAVWWDYINDPHGLTKSINEYDSGSHRVFRPNVMSYVGGSWMHAALSYNSQQFYNNQAGAPITFFSATRGSVAMQPNFAGKIGPQDGNISQTHGSQLPSSTFLTDARPLIGGSDAKLTGTFTSVSGQLYKYASGSILDRKHLPTMVEGAGRPLLDISSATTGDQIGTTSTDSYKYCYAEKVNECRTGSSAGDLYVNIPSLVSLLCYNNGIDVVDGSGNYVRDVCASNNPAYMQGVIQVSNDHDVFGYQGRVLTNALAKYKKTFIYWNTRLLPNASWGLILSSQLDNSRDEVLMVKIPPRVTDSINRTTFIPIKVSNTTFPGGSNRMIIKFGYNTSFYCTSRAEVCYATGATVSESTPFTWSGDLASGDGSATGTISIPAIPGKILYFQIVWRNGTTTVRTEPVTVLAVP